MRCRKNRVSAKRYSISFRLCWTTRDEPRKLGQKDATMRFPIKNRVSAKRVILEQVSTSLKGAKCINVSFLFLAAITTAFLELELLAGECAFFVQDKSWRCAPCLSLMDTRSLMCVYISIVSGMMAGSSPYLHDARLRQTCTDSYKRRSLKVAEPADCL